MLRAHPVTPLLEIASTVGRPVLHAFPFGSVEWNTVPVHSARLIRISEILQTVARGHRVTRLDAAGVPVTGADLTSGIIPETATVGAGRLVQLISVVAGLTTVVPLRRATFDAASQGRRLCAAQSHSA